MTCPRCSRELPDDAAYCCYCGRALVKRPQPKRHARGNGSGSAYRRGKTWTASLTVSFVLSADGNYHQKRKTKAGFKTRNEALEWLVLAKQGAPTRTAPTLASYWVIMLMK